MSDITDRLDKLEAAMLANQLPPSFTALQRKLEQNWQPDASVLLQAGSIGTDSLADGAVTDAKLSAARGQATAVGTGVSFADITITDNLHTTTKRGGGWEHVGGTFIADATFVRILSTALNTTTLRVITRLGGNIGVGATILVDYFVWK